LRATPDSEPWFEGFENLMPFRVQNILLVSSLYDSFILREDGRTIVFQVAPNANKVQIKHADTADDVFSKLRGDAVDPRRDFIQANALQVANLDV
jgi:hypothetical protein